MKMTISNMAITLTKSEKLLLHLYLEEFYRMDPREKGLKEEHYQTLHSMAKSLMMAISENQETFTIILMFRQEGQDLADLLAFPGADQYVTMFIGTLVNQVRGLLPALPELFPAPEFLETSDSTDTEEVQIPKTCKECGCYEFNRKCEATIQVNYLHDDKQGIEIGVSAPVTSGADVTVLCAHNETYTGWSCVECGSDNIIYEIREVQVDACEED